eukprot:gene26350-32919_t
MKVSSRMFDTSCTFQPESIQLKTPADTDISQIKAIDLPAQSAQVVELIGELQKCSEALQIDFLGLVVTPPPEEGTQTVENRLELLTLPTTGIERSCTVMNSFDEATTLEVKRFVDNLLLEVDESHASTYMRAESEANGRETSLKTMRDEIERERKGQESVLRDMRQNAANEGAGGGGNMAHSGSAARLQQGVINGVTESKSPGNEAEEENNLKTVFVEKVTALSGVVSKNKTKNQRNRDKKKKLSVSQDAEQTVPTEEVIIGATDIISPAVSTISSSEECVSPLSPPLVSSTDVVTTVPSPPSRQTESGEAKNKVVESVTCEGVKKKENTVLIGGVDVTTTTPAVSETPSDAISPPKVHEVESPSLRDQVKRLTTQLNEVMVRLSALESK